MAAVIGSLRVVLGADTGSFEDGLKKAGSLLTSFGKITAGVAAGNLLAKAIEKTVAALADLLGATFHAIDAMDKMGKEAQKLGVGVVELSKLSVTAKLADVDISELSKSVVQLSKRMVEGADNGTAPARRALTALGISFKEFVALKPDQQMALLADRFSQFRDGADKTAAATALFGRAGANLIPMLNEGSKKFGENAEMARKLGLVMSGETAKAAEKFNDTMKLVGLGLSQGVFNVIAEKLLPIFNLLADGLLKLTVGFMSLIGAGKTMEQAMADAKKALNMPTDEAARQAQQLADKLFSLQTQARTLRGDFLQLAPGFIEAATSMKLLKGNAENLPIIVGQLSERLKLLNQELFNFKAQQITQENLLPLEAFTMKMTELENVYRNTTMSVETFQRAQEKLAQQFGMTWTAMGSNVANFAGSMATLTRAVGKENKSMIIASKAFGIAQAIINTQIAITKALAELPPPASYVAVAAAVAAGAAAVATIAAQGFAQGGSFKVPGTGGGTDSMPVGFMATPGERVTVETPAQQRGGADTVIQLRGKSFGFDDIRDVFEQINAGMRDGHRFLVARA